ncbi:MAG: DUF1598 domain-containing protein [Planctomycetota bacterium]
MSFQKRPFHRSHSEFSPSPGRLVIFGHSIAPVLASMSIVFVLVVSASVALHAGFIGGAGRGAVGGVDIDAAGVLTDATPAQGADLAAELRQSMQRLDGDLAQASERRVISLAAVQTRLKNLDIGQHVPSDLEYLAGLTKIEAVIVDAENNDILISGPAEPWRVDDSGNVVGKESGQAIMRLSHLLVAMQDVQRGVSEGIQCSIEPTPEGRRNLQSLLSKVRLSSGQNPAYLEPAMREAFGPQIIRLSGVPTDSRFARTMVAADYEMKRIAMALAPSEVQGLPSYLQLSRNASHNAAQNPRWWMAVNYDEVQFNEDKSVWTFNGSRIKTLTEQDQISRDGSAKATGRKDALAQKWANLMNERLEQLLIAKPIFGELANVIDATMVATLIEKENFEHKAGLDLTPMRELAVDHLASFEVPQTISPQCSFIKTRGGWTVTASGGVDIDALTQLDNAKSGAKVDRAELLVSRSNDRWFWDVQ